MGETANLGLPLLAPSQAQKHVTVNEALSRLDALAKGVLASRRVSTPPAEPRHGEVWAVPAGATDEWAGREGDLAISTGGGWSFVAPREGWRAFVLDEGAPLRHDGGGWIADRSFGVLAASASGAATTAEVVEFEHRIAAGVMSDTADVIPRKAIVLGVTGRIQEEITGTLTGWRLGTRGASTSFGTGLSVAAGSYVEGPHEPTKPFWSGGPLRLTAEDGQFAGGLIRFAIHVIRLTPPTA